MKIGREKNKSKSNIHNKLSPSRGHSVSSLSSTWVMVFWTFKDPGLTDEYLGHIFTAGHVMPL